MTPNWSTLLGTWHGSYDCRHCRVIVLSCMMLNQWRDAGMLSQQECKTKQNKTKPSENTMWKRNARGNSRSRLRLNRQTDILVFPLHKVFIVTALRKQIWPLPQENSNETRAASKIHFPHPVKMWCCYTARQSDFVSHESNGEAAAGRHGPCKLQASCPHALALLKVWRCILALSSLCACSLGQILPLGTLWLCITTSLLLASGWWSRLGPWAVSHMSMCAS